MENRSWQHQQYDGFERQVNIDKNRAIQKWTPVIESFQFDEYTFDIVIEKMSVFAELYQMVDSNKTVSVGQPWSPIAGVHVGGLGQGSNGMGQVYPQTNMKNPTTVDPPGWVELPLAMGMISDRIKYYMKNNSNVNLEIIKEYYNVITKKKTLLLKDVNGRVILDFKLEEEKKQKLLLEIDDEIFFILDPAERKRLTRIKKLNRILYDLDSE